MAALTDARIFELLEPFAAGAPGLRETVCALLPKFSAYLDLLLRWNARTNLTSVRDPEQMVQRHFGESIFAAGILLTHNAAGRTLLDLGSGAGFPGMPVQMCLPDLRVTLAESQSKKASFLREAVRTLAVPAEVWAARAESMSAGRTFDVVTLRAVDRMEDALVTAKGRVQAEGSLLALTGSEVPTAGDWKLLSQTGIPHTRQRYVSLLKLHQASVFASASSSF